MKMNHMWSEGLNKFVQFPAESQRNFLREQLRPRPGPHYRYTTMLVSTVASGTAKTQDYLLFPSKCVHSVASNLLDSTQSRIEVLGHM